MPMLLRLILAEDSDDDAALVLRAVERAGFDVQLQRVDSSEGFAAALASGDWDAIISDHAMPQFSSAAALAMLREDGRDLPFLVVSGTIDEEAAVNLLRTGAHDFVTKQNLARLGPALKRELKEAENRAQHRAAQQDLRRQRDFLRLVIDTSPNLVYVMDGHGRFVLANQATADLYGTTVENLIDPQKAIVASVLGDLVSGGPTSASRKVEAIAHPRTGETLWFDVLAVPLPDTGLGAQHLVIAIDISERKRTADALSATEAQLMHAQKMEAIGQLAGGIAHDFNNLLTVILGFSQIALDRAKGQPELEADLTEIVNSGQRASLLTRQLLTFSRKQVMELKVLDINTVVAELDKLLRRVIGEDVSFKTKLASSLSPVLADPGQIEQIIVNLVVNARDAMPDGGVLTIETFDRPPLVQLKVIDTGVGIPEDIQTRIFEPFFTTKPDGKGTGLGLSTVYGIVKQIGGEIGVESVLTLGTTFTISLPASAAPLPAPVTGSGNDALRGTETILLVEDEEGVRLLVERGLVRFGYRVLSAGTASEALAIDRSHAGVIDLLLTDVVMPTMRGPALAMTMRGRRPEMAVLYMSGFTYDADANGEAIEVSANFLQKPFTPTRLAEKVRECLRMRSEARES